MASERSLWFPRRLSSSADSLNKIVDGSVALSLERISLSRNEGLGFRVLFVAVCRASYAVQISIKEDLWREGLPIFLNDDNFSEYVDDKRAMRSASGSFVSAASRLRNTLIFHLAAAVLRFALLTRLLTGAIPQSISKGDGVSLIKSKRCCLALYQKVRQVPFSISLACHCVGPCVFVVLRGFTQ